MSARASLPMTTLSAPEGSRITREPRSSSGVEGGMKTLSAVIVLAAVLVVPASAVAKPDASDKRAAIAQCKSERGKSKATRRAFKAKYHGFSRCIHQTAAEEHAEKKAALKNAAKQCKAERGDADFPASHDGKTFQEFYGKGKHGRNAFGKCVSAKA